MKKLQKEPVFQLLGRIKGRGKSLNDQRIVMLAEALSRKLETLQISFQ